MAVFAASTPDTPGGSAPAQGSADAQGPLGRRASPAPIPAPGSAGSMPGPAGSMPAPAGSMPAPAAPAIAPQSPGH
ncbi:hypothetical protein DL89DRAFT_264251 [Linderina pennispora]|uniref:Uncharacterized protein n=1 Tax=Linderina pennispora TaxID=61395 RepID=A0A1Y1WLH8_9FUNG|nr:uncharacterized protein DL89DRAFT_264251 [Linderina pennispora]ORX74352.1 hypothetical protein DL89DRAFT_264251 [Linderina pennispora]